MEAPLYRMYADLCDAAAVVIGNGARRSDSMAVNAWGDRVCPGVLQNRDDSEGRRPEEIVSAPGEAAAAGRENEGCGCRESMCRSVPAGDDAAPEYGSGASGAGARRTGT